MVVPDKFLSIFPFHLSLFRSSSAINTPTYSSFMILNKEPSLDPALVMSLKTQNWGKEMCKVNIYAGVISVSYCHAWHSWHIQLWRLFHNVEILFYFTFIIIFLSQNCYLILLLLIEILGAKLCSIFQYKYLEAINWLLASSEVSYIFSWVK